jgi:hypothetical protein
MLWNYYHTDGRYSFIDLRETNTRRKILSIMFNWSDSPEGFNYWNELYNDSEIIKVE